MIKVSVLYPNQEGYTFDMAYYCDRHMPMVRQLLGGTLKGMSVEQGISGVEPGSRPSYLALGHLLFESVAAFQTAWGPHAQKIIGDIPNYTNSPPTIQISEVRM